MSREVVVVSAVRTPIGRIRGGLSSVRADDLGALVIAAALTRAGVDGEAVDEVVFGCANQAGEDNRNVARMALLLAGLPQKVPGITVNRLCASGLSAVNIAARQILLGDEGASHHDAPLDHDRRRGPGVPELVPETSDVAVTPEGPIAVGHHRQLIEIAGELHEQLER